MRDRVARLRSLLSEATEVRKPELTPEAQALRAFQLHEFNAAPPLVLDQSPRARSTREIMRIANGYGWTSEVERALDAAGATMLSSLSDLDLEDLLARMRRLEDCVHMAGDSPDAPPAR